MIYLMMATFMTGVTIVGVLNLIDDSKTSQLNMRSSVEIDEITSRIEAILSNPNACFETLVNTDDPGGAFNADNDIAVRHVYDTNSNALYTAFLFGGGQGTDYAGGTKLVSFSLENINDVATGSYPAETVLADFVIGWGRDWDYDATDVPGSMARLRLYKTRFPVVLRATGQSQPIQACYALNGDRGYAQQVCQASGGSLNWEGDCSTSTTAVGQNLGETLQGIQNELSVQGVTHESALRKTICKAICACLDPEGDGWDNAEVGFENTDNDGVDERNTNCNGPSSTQLQNCTCPWVD